MRGLVDDEFGLENCRYEHEHVLKHNIYRMNVFILQTPGHFHTDNPTPLSRNNIFHTFFRKVELGK